jgi:hypothetical protein
VGGLFGGASHTILDGLVHTDVRPWAPLTESNSLYGLLTWNTVEIVCVAAGICALTLLTGRMVLAFRAG